MKFQFSIIVPVYNRPQEIDELLQSLVDQSYEKDFEVIVVEDGSSEKAEEIIEKYSNILNLKYFYKENTGAGMSRNFGMQRASGNYFIIFDSDCIIPPNYLTEVDSALTKNYTDAFGGADAAHDSFASIQKAINFSMTSVLTTGGIRGKKKSVGKFQPRSFNLGMSKKAFEITNGFSEMKIGEDIDFTFRLWENGCETQFIENAFVYHKRRSTFKQFFKQTYAFGKGRPFLNRKYPGTANITYWFPSLFIIALMGSIILGIMGEPLFTKLFAVYFVLLFLLSLFENKSLPVAVLSVFTTVIQFFGYGIGFLKGVIVKES